MSSKTIYSHVPYFYIIQHEPSGLLYAGSKSGIGANPIHLLTKTGYKTSSPKVKELIERDGLSSFKILLTLEESECNMSVYDYESLFLQSWNIADDPQWINQHNNIFDSTFNSETYRRCMFEKYGAFNPLQSPIIRQKIKATLLERYGVENVSQIESVRLKKEQTCLEHFGVKYPLLAEVNKEKAKQTSLQNYGVEHHMKSKEFMLEYKQHLTETKGVENVFQLEEIKDKIIKTNLTKYGVSHHMKSEKGKRLNREKFSNTTWWNDGIKSYRLKEKDIPNPAWLPGMVSRKKS